VLNPAVGSRLPELSALVQSMDAREDIPQIEIAAGDAMTALVFRHMKPLSDGDRAKLVAFAQQTGLAVMLQPGGNDSVVPLWPDLVPLSFGLADYQLDIAFEPLDFVQVNAAMNARMIDHALSLLDAQPEDHVLDLFCGLGNFTLPIARRAGHVVGVEGDSGLVARARANAERNGLADKAEYFAANLFEDQRSEPWAKREYQRVLLDPPRAGAQEILGYLPGKATHRVVYVSCHPASLARDAGILVNQHGFKLKSAGVMDMFPHTAHVESIALFERAKRG
jgi:23S rRNA (uracil1939-C5)-methyltransferase